MEFVNSQWVTAAGATVGTIAVAIAAIVFLRWKDENTLTRVLVYVLVLGLVGAALFLNFQERKNASTIAAEVGKTLDKCRATLDTLNGQLIVKILDTTTPEGAHAIALQMKDLLDNTECKR
jgi:hypothetical protein